MTRHIAERAGAEGPISSPRGGDVAGIVWHVLGRSKPFVPVKVFRDFEFLGRRFGVTAPAFEAPDVDFGDFADRASGFSQKHGNPRFIAAIETTE